MYTVYKHTNVHNNKVYIGLTKQQPEARWGHNGCNYRNRCPHFWAAIQKWGWDAFIHEICYSELTKEEACEKEKVLIKEYNAQNPKHGYNILEGGSAPIIPKEIREKMSKAMIGNKNGLGHPCSVEKAKKISEAQKGKIVTEETRKKQSLAKKGKPGPKCSEEKKAKISASHKKKAVYCEETGKIYISIQQCARELNISATSICACCKGKHKSHKGYHFSYSNV